MNTVTLRIEGMCCDGCLETVKTVLGANEGVLLIFLGLWSIGFEFVLDTGL